MHIPSLITAGDSVAWVEPPAAALGQVMDSRSWALGFSFRGRVGNGLDIAGTPSGSGWALNLASADTASLNQTPSQADWSWQACVIRGADRITVGTGVLRVAPNLFGMAQTAVFDGRSQAERHLEAIRAEIGARIDGGATLEYTINNRSLKKEPMSELVKLEQRCLRIVAREKQAQAAANGLGNPKRMSVRFR